MILERLRAETRPHHTRLESALALPTALHSVAQYRALLGNFLGIYEPMEGALAACPGLLALLPDLEERWKSPWLRADLAVLGLNEAAIAALPRATALPPLSEPLAALGSLYVMEGATLGGQIVARYMAEHFGLRAGHGSSFFHSYGAARGARWQRFRDALHAAAPDDPTIILHAAQQCFLAFEAWLPPSGDPHE